MTPWTTAPQASLSFTIAQSLLKLTTPGWERSPGVGNGNPLQYFCMEDEGWEVIPPQDSVLGLGHASQARILE